MRHIYILLLSSILSISNIYSQEDSNKKIIDIEQGVGATAGFTTGLGMSYQIFMNNFGISCSFAPQIEKGERTFHAGLTFKYKLFENEVSNFFIYQGNHFQHDLFHNEYYDTYKDQDVDENITDSYLNNGLGIGLELVLLKKVGFNFMGGYAFYEYFYRLSFTGETALYYRF